jgi:hypothetical protein
MQKIAPNSASQFDYFATEYYGNRKMIAEPLMTLLHIISLYIFRDKNHI